MPFLGLVILSTAGLDGCVCGPRSATAPALKFPWDASTCNAAAEFGHLATLRWARENGCPWHPVTRDRAAAELGYTDDLGTLWEEEEESDDEYGYEDSDEVSDDE